MRSVSSLSFGVPIPLWGCFCLCCLLSVFSSSHPRPPTLSPKNLAGFLGSQWLLCFYRHLPFLHESRGETFCFLRILPHFMSSLVSELGIPFRQSYNSFPFSSPSTIVFKRSRRLMPFHRESKLNSHPTSGWGLSYIWQEIVCH